MHRTWTVHRPPLTVDRMNRCPAGGGRFTVYGFPVLRPVCQLLRVVVDPEENHGQLEEDAVDQDDDDEHQAAEHRSKEEASDADTGTFRTQWIAHFQ